jgi:hypothetical protein
LRADKEKQMIGQAKTRNIVVSMGLLTLTLGASPAAAVLQGDCNNNLTTAIAEVQRCANIFQGTQPLTECSPCDQNANGAVSIAEVQGAANCFLDSSSAGCRMSTPGPGEPTNTSPAATNTPEPPTNTVPPTSTPVTPTNTVPPTSTPVTPTNTVAPTSTPVTPTNTPENTPTATASGGALLMGIAPGGGTAGNCRGTCVAGSNMGLSCAINDECPGSTCSPTSVCSGGTNNGNACQTAGNCPGGACNPARTCLGGGYDSFMCSASTNCNGCDPNRICRGAGNPLACCTANQAGTCPLRGSCAIIQGTIPVRVSLNGVCLPRSYPPGDLDCTTNTECRTCVGGDNAGKSCRLVSHCPGGTCSNPGVCQLAEVGAEIGGQQANGERPITLRQDTLILNPAYIPSLGTACVTAGGDGMGVIDCDGGRPNRNFTLRKDHNTTPGSAGNGGTGGLANDPDCDDTFTAPDGTVNYTCVEGMMQCAGGTNVANPCTTDDQCPGSNCGACNIGTNNGPHTGVCNSPTVLEQGGNFVAGDTAVALPLAIALLDARTDPPPADYGADGLPCTPDDAAPPGNAVPVALSSGTNQVFIYDRANTAGLVLGPGQLCGASPCAASVAGQGISCAMVDQGTLAGLTLGGGFPALDSPAGDIATTFQFTLEER